MSDVSFNEPQYTNKASAHPPKASLLTRATIGLRLAKDETGAQKTMAIGTVVIVFLSVGIYMYGNTAYSSSNATKVIEGPIVQDRNP